MERKTHRGRTPRYDWSTVDWSTTNAEIAEFLGGRIALETVARKRVELGHPTVYPESLRDRLARAEAEVERLRAWLSKIEGGDVPCEDAAQLRRWAWEAGMGREADG